MALGALVVRLGLDAAEFTSAMSKAEYSAKQFVQNTMSTATRLAGVFTVISGAVGGALTALDNLTGGIANYQDLADKMGASAEAVASLQRAADLSGTSLDTVARASGRLTDSLTDIEGAGKDSAAALGAIGISVQDFQRMDPVTQMEQIALALGKFEDGAGKTAIAMALFGRSGAELMPMFQDLYEEGGRHLVLTQQQIAAADEYNRRFAEAKSMLSQTAQVVIAESIPAFTVLLDQLVELISNSGDLGKSTAVQDFAFGAARALAVLAESLVVVAKGIRALAGSFEVVWADLQLVSAFINNGGALGLLFEKNRKNLADALEKRNKTLEDANNRYKDLWNFDATGISRAIKEAQEIARLNKVGDLPVADSWNFNFRKQLNFEVPKGGGTTGKTGAAARQSEAERYIASLEKTYETTQELTRYEQLMWDVSQGRLGKLKEGELERAIAIAKSIDAAEAAAKAEKQWADQQKQDMADVKKVWDDLTAATAATENSLKQLAAGWIAHAQAVEDVRDPIGKLIRDLEQIDKLAAGGYLKPEEVTRIKNTLGEDPTEESKENVDALAEYGKNAAQLMQKSLADYLFDPFADGTDDMVDNFAKALQRMLAEASTVQLMKILFGDFGATGKMGGWFGKLFSGTAGAVVSGDSGLPQMAAGTNYVPYDGMKAILHRGEAVVPREYNPAAGGMAPGGISVAVHMPPNSSQANMPPMEFQRVMRYAVAEGVAEARRRGARL